MDRFTLFELHVDNPEFSSDVSFPAPDDEELGGNRGGDTAAPGVASGSSGRSRAAWLAPVVGLAFLVGAGAVVRRLRRGGDAEQDDDRDVEIELSSAGPEIED
ncbi:hypothetical protein [Halobaculum sp. D14]|uniref:hypothetical protein n=1 Tax=Halobaculum sp. D14 TaxID=3421642 RepID=UPI003EC0D721